tara:strand:+ start:25139 stop:26329 length:1191 start_codon:yes stop_codon:yes gene_type:complete
MKPLQRRPLYLAIRAVTVAGGMTLAATPALAGFSEVTTNNPFAAINSGTTGVSLTLTDLDGDGDLDALVWHRAHDDVFPFNSSDMSLYENTGTRTEAVFTQVQDFSGYGYGGDNFDANPFTYDWGGSSYGHPVSAGDLNQDGLDDFVGGNANVDSLGFLHGISVNDGYGQATDLDNRYDESSGNSMFYGTNIMPYGDAYGYGSPLLLDLDNDTDTDIITSSNGFLFAFQNNSPSMPTVLQLAQLQGPAHPFVGGATLALGNAYLGAPMAAGDLDNDGDLDILLGVAYGPENLRYFINTGSTSTAQFEEKTFADLDVSTTIAAAPATGDIDGDGDDDVVVVEQQASGPATFRLFLNDGAVTRTVPISSSSSGGGIGGAFLAVFAGAAMLRRRKSKKS